MRLTLLAAVLLSLTACQAEPPADPIRPVLLFVDENGVKVYGFYYNGLTRCYAVGGSVIYTRTGGKHSRDDDAPTVEMPDPRTVRIEQLRAEIERLSREVR